MAWRTRMSLSGASVACMRSAVVSLFWNGTPRSPAPSSGPSETAMSVSSLVIIAARTLPSLRHWYSALAKAGFSPQ